MKFKKIFNLFLVMFILVFALLIISCNKQNEIITTNDLETNSITDRNLKLTNVFTSTTSVTLPRRYEFYNNNYFHRMFILDDRIYFTADEYMNNTETTKLMLHSFDTNSEYEHSDTIYPLNENGSVKFMWLDSEYNEITVEEFDYVYYLNKISKTGDVIFTKPITDIFANAPDAVKSIAVGENDNIYLGTDYYVAVLSKDGVKICELKMDYILDHISSAHGKKPILKMYDPNNNYSVRYSFINAESKSLEDVEMKINTNLFYLYSEIIYGDGYDYYHFTHDGVYGYNNETNETTQVLSWINSDMNFSEIKMFSILSPEKMFMVTYDQILYTSSFNILNHIPDDQVPEKEYLLLGYIEQSMSEYLNNIVASFNKNNSKYRIIIKNYFDDDYDKSLLNFNKDISTGKEPDLLLINNYIPFLNYAKKDLFIDLYEYLKQDDSLYKNLLPFVLKPSEINNKLYQLTTSFSPLTLMGKTSNLNDKTSWSMGEMLDYIKLPDKIQMLSNDKKKDFYQYIFIENTISECIDYNDGTCNFDNQGFKDMLELIKLLPDIITQDDDYYDNMRKFRNDEILLYNMYIYDFFSYVRIRSLAFTDEEITFIGYPSLNGDKAISHITKNGFAILNSSAKKDIAWEFIKYCLSDNVYKLSINSFGIPPTRNAIDLNTYEYYDHYAYYLYSGGAISYIPPLTQNEKNKYGEGVDVHIDEKLINEYYSYFETIDNFTYTDDIVYEIINEELDIFINTNKSVDDTVKTIQNRVSLYMNEFWN